MKSSNAKSFKKKHNYAFQYEQFDKRLTKDKWFFKAIMLHFLILVGQTNYILKDLIDDFMSLKIKIVFKPNLKDLGVAWLCWIG
jgi:hypothetical protein